MVYSAILPTEARMSGAEVWAALPKALPPVGDTTAGRMVDGKSPAESVHASGCSRVAAANPVPGTSGHRLMS